MNQLLETYIEKKNNLFQSDAWRDYQLSLGREVFLISCNDCDVLVVKLPLYKDLSYLYCPRAPQTTKEGWYLFMNRLRELAKNEKAVFVRVEPFKTQSGLMKKLKFSPVKSFSPLAQQYSPMNTLLLDLNKSENELLAEMKSKCRYNIKVAEKKGVSVRKSKSLDDLKKFYELSVGMSERGYSAFDFEHYKRLFESLSKTKNMIMYVAEHEKDVLSVILVSHFNEVAIYLHGASGDLKRELMPNHLIQWEAIKDAKKAGCLVYDFWGTAPENVDNHKWSGITRFKVGFGGERVQFLGAFDYTFLPIWYIIFCLANFVRKGIRK